MTLESQSSLETPTKYVQNHFVGTFNNKNDAENNNNTGNNTVAVVCSTRSSSSRQAKIVSSGSTTTETIVNTQACVNAATSFGDNETKKVGVGPTLRSSARVPKRSRECDAATTSDGPISANKKLTTGTSKADNIRLDKVKTRRTWELWSVEDKNLFFEALCEYGKDFENIQIYIFQKTRKKGHPPPIIKNKDQVRHFYYRTWHKIAKHLNFNNDIKKQVQELYGLINYGELRKKIGGRLDEKNGQKLKELVYSGVTMVRCKGKNVRIKTPVCRALKTLNEVEASKDGDNAKLPNRVILEVRPRNNRSWSIVQSVSQNPRVRMDVSLQCRLAVILRYLQERWRSPALKQRDEVASHFNGVEECKDEQFQNGNLCYLKLFPQKGDKINPVCVKTNVEVANLNVSLQNYRFKNGLDPANGTLSESACSVKKSLKNKSKLVVQTSTKIPEDRGGASETEVTDNIDKSSNNGKVIPAHEVTMRQLLALETAAVEPVTPSFLKDSPLSPTTVTSRESIKTECSKDETGNHLIFIKPGWSSKTCNTLTVGQVYLMLGKPQKLTLEYEWEFETSSMSRPPVATFTSVLTRLLQLASVTYSDLNKTRGNISCPCGHVCPISSSSSLTAKPNVGIRGSSKPAKCAFSKTDVVLGANSSVTTTDDVFRKPINVQPRPPIKYLSANETVVPCDKALKEQLEKNAQSRKSKGRIKKTVLVQRELPLLPKGAPGNSMMTLRLVPGASQLTGSFFLPASAVLSKTTSVNSAFVRPTALNDTRTLQQPNTVMVVSDQSPIFLQQTSSLITNEISQVKSDSSPVSTAAVNQKHVLTLLPVNMESSSPSIPQISISESGTTTTTSVSPLTISSLLDISLTEPEAGVGTGSGTADKLLDIALGNSASDFCGFISLNNLSGVEDQNKTSGDVEFRPVTPVNSPTNSLFKFSSPGLDGSSWLNGEASNFSLTNFLSHLESPLKTPANAQNSSASQTQSELAPNFHGLMNENCIDYTSKFEDLAARE